MSAPDLYLAESYGPPLPKPRTWRNAKYLAWVRKKPCVVFLCRSTKIEAAHVGVKGRGVKSDDFRTVPLCRDHHQEQHTIGRKTFEKRYGISLNNEWWFLWQVSPWKEEIETWMEE